MAAVLGLSSTVALGAPLAQAAPLGTAQGGTTALYSTLAPAPAVRDDSPDTFTLGVLTDVSKHKVDVRSRNGDTQTFKLDGDTVIRDEDGNRKSHDDLQVGDVVIVTTGGDDDDTADLLVDGGANGFREGGAFDIGQRLDERGRWDWRAHQDGPPPFDPRAMGAIRRHFFQPNGQQNGWRPSATNSNNGRPNRFGWTGQR
jgi:hypothetical protein